ncbi:type III secretion system ATPase SctN [Chloracidobacterium aggregatum]|uniref:type III secretion system ATPase SctN n=1 Tax=Chloracidobacterium aggregatum TaxID=2851959 RepID=UPI001B8C8BBF|nr:type III secretion system ATPase SctN [Chloracidobacterium aggregatum]QUV86401.1 type III secretion system ATPase SctN [Chloracidobacterium sp. 2]QUV89168.1 type III secretion system ATPase SctN [Chloracidobacterium sp. S]QUV98521.1 type III secretion system ATPase SctN [Chloracidobacterium sp. E]
METLTLPKLDLSPYLRALDWLPSVEVRGRVTELVGLLVRASVPGARVEELCLIRSPHRAHDLKAEVVGFRGSEIILMPLGELQDVAMGAEVISTGGSLKVRVGDSLLGRVLDGLGEPMDGKGPIPNAVEVSVTARPPDPMKRQRVTKRFMTGVRAIDATLTVGEGQRVGVFAAAGVGKSTLLGMLARNTEAEVNVIALIGERGREVRDFLEHDLGPEGLKRSVIVVATSNEPSLVRLKAAHVATAIAEYFRDQGKKVLLMMDSVTRFARALREVGLATGEPPARAGFPPSVFSELPKLLERTGNSQRGSITAFYTVLVEGDDMTEPIADETRSILDGHIILSRALAAAGHYPAIDVRHSVSRVMTAVADKDHIAKAMKLRDILDAYESQKDLILIGAYKSGKDKRTDYAISKIDAVNQFLRQPTSEKADFQDTLNRLTKLVS